MLVYYSNENTRQPVGSQALGRREPPVGGRAILAPALGAAVPPRNNSTTWTIVGVVVAGFFGLATLCTGMHAVDASRARENAETAMRAAETRADRAEDEQKRSRRSEEEARNKAIENVAIARQLNLEIVARDIQIADLEHDVAALEEELRRVREEHAALKKEYDLALSELRTQRVSADDLRARLVEESGRYAAQNQVVAELRAVINEQGSTLVGALWTSLVEEAAISECMPYARNAREKGCIEETARTLSTHRERFERCILETHATPMYVEGMTSASGAGLDVVKLRRGSVVFCDRSLSDAG